MRLCELADVEASGPSARGTISAAPPEADLSGRSRTDQRLGVVPGRGVVRISLTPACNLRCRHCHNEGQAAPWLHRAAVAVTIDQIDAVIRASASRGARTVRFTGGDPGMYRHFLPLMSAVASWRAAHPSIGKWALTTNGIAFLNSAKFSSLAQSALTDVAIGIDSIEPGELSRPSSPVGISGHELFERFVKPLKDSFPGSIKIDVVFNGNEPRTRNVIRRARALGLAVTVIEINGVMGKTYHTRAAFIQLREDVASEFALTPRLCEDLNEVYLYDSAGRQVMKFYQDHCSDRECHVCRKLDFRIVQCAEGLAAIPCYEQAQAKVIDLMVDGKLCEERLDDAIRHNGRGPHWFAGTRYDPPA
jgi:molybdenum cofactor biosynthesis enzyme MoaA